MKRSVSYTFLLLGVGTLVSGCPQTETPPGGPVPPGVPIGSTLATATFLPLNDSDKAVIAGTLSGSKVDVYDLGPVNPGDRIIVNVRPASGSPLDPVTALFDADSILFAFNDDADLAAGRVDSFIDDFIAKPGDHLYLALTKFHLSAVAGSYEGDIEIRRNQSPPAPQPQVLLLNFAGGSVSIPGEGTYNFGPFNSADIDADYDGQTAAIKAKIVETVRQNYQNFGITIVSSDDPPVDNSQCNVSTIHFGAFSQSKFGIAQSVDAANRNHCDDGIVFTDDFDKPFSPMPSADGIGIAIGNVAAHEAGHLLGLNHVTDITDLMDNTGSASTLLADQEFKNSPLSPSIFPFGTQDGAAMLNRVIPK